MPDIIINIHKHKMNMPVNIIDSFILVKNLIYIYIWYKSTLTCYYI